MKKFDQNVWVSSIYIINICSNTLIKLQFKPIVSIHKFDAINKTLVVTDAFGFNNPLYLFDIVECNIHR
ncbi:hypothetical protein COA08_29630 [Bacillus cereus]|uniref:Uncharacterized protein n=1 Tax=Bacillus cereus TaxID=1396 RepID=A0A2C0DY40_BACCE|nr:hypothetical protein COJ43_08205 [Bacillus cereus]PGL56400.1 hypothetical protein CN927_28965 [Bacillus cereus]PGQ04632.1 hypothetical protein COA08_29630 [Bacillus cereus]